MKKQENKGYGNDLDFGSHGKRLGFDKLFELNCLEVIYDEFI